MVREESDELLCEPELCLLSSLAALESESCQEAAKTLVEMSVLAASAQHSRRLVVFIIICNSCYAFSAQYSAGSLRSGPNTLILFTGYPTTVAFPVKNDPQTVAKAHTIHHALTQQLVHFIHIAVS